MDAAVGCHQNVLGPQVVVAHAAPRQAPHQPEQAKLNQDEAEPGGLESAERSAGHALQDQDLLAVGFDQLERLGDAGQAPAAPQQIELAAQILPAPPPDLPLVDDLVEAIARQAEGAGRIQRAGPAARVLWWCPGAARRAYRDRDFLVGHARNRYQHERLSSTVGYVGW